jgi:hypothetical protein
MASNLRVDNIQFPNGTSYTSGHVIGVSHFQNSTRTAVPGSGQSLPYILWNAGNVVKKQSGSILLVEAQLPFRNGNSYDFGPLCRIGGVVHYDGVVFAHYNSDALGSGDTIKTALIWKCKHSGASAGNVSIEFGWHPANGGTGERPGEIWNPNASDNDRARQWTSDCIVWEIEV